MRAKVARRGRNPGGEFWGCNAFRSKGCRGTLEVPRQEWDWFGLVRIPVSIIRNAQRRFDADMEEFREYEHGLDGMFGSSNDYDGDIPYVEQAMETENRYWENIENAEIAQILNGPLSGYSLARRVIELVNKRGMSVQTRDAIAYAITENFAGSAPAALVSVSPEYPGHLEYGIVYLDDGSDLRFNRTTLGIQMFVMEAGFGSVMLRESDFKCLAQYFMQHFGSHAPAGISYL